MADFKSLETGNEQSVFGAGLKRKRIEFVPAEGPSIVKTPSGVPSFSLGERYLSITLKDCASSTDTAKTADLRKTNIVRRGEAENGLKNCAICKSPVDAEGSEAPLHQVSLAHQVCLDHSFPPSHLDRNSQGLKYLSYYGWDPDGQLGLGASGAGIRVPIRANVKHDTVGLGVKLPGEKQRSERVIEKFDAKQLRRKVVKEKLKNEKLREKFYANSDVERYLGTS